MKEHLKIKGLPEDLYDNIPCGLLLINSRGNIVFINNTLLKWLGYDKNEINDKNSFQDILSVGGKIFFQTHLFPLLELQNEIFEISLELVAKNKSKIQVLINANKIRSKKNTEDLFCISILNIAQRKLYEKELLAARKQAETANLKLQQINEELEHFTSIVSHDLQAPVNTILGLLSLLEMRQTDTTVANDIDIPDLIGKNAHRMKSIIHETLDFTRLKNKKTDFENVSINKVCNQCIEMLRSEIEKNNAVFNIPELPFVYGNKTQLIRLFQNLFSNAIKYHSEASPVVTISFEEKKKHILFTVQDNGIGFGEENEGKIFDFMKRLVSDSFVEGNGIGLSSCKRIIENHGGTISAKSKVGKGSAFYFSLPKSVIKHP